jgi:DNA-binding MarR family transcriptional regulator
MTTPSISLSRPAAGTEPRWLDDQQQGAWRSVVALIELLPAALDRQLQVDSGIPHTYYMILAMLSEAPDRSLRMTQLAHSTNGSQSRLSHAVARLEQRGWVERQQCPTDRRGQVAVLTEEGFAALEQIAPGHVAEVRRTVFDKLTAEQVAQLTEIAHRITDGLGESQASANCPDTEPAGDQARAS